MKRIKNGVDVSSLKGLIINLPSDNTMWSELCGSVSINVADEVWNKIEIVLYNKIRQKITEKII